MPINRLNTKVLPEKEAAIMAALTTIKTELPFLIGLTPEERQGQAKMGDKTVAFVDKALDVVARHPEILPGTFDADDFETDVALIHSLKPISNEVRDLLEKLDDTIFQASSEAFGAALKVYQFAKVNGVEGELDDELADMGKRFARKAMPAEPVEPA